MDLPCRETQSNGLFFLSPVNAGHKIEEEVMYCLESLSGNGLKSMILMQRLGLSVKYAHDPDTTLGAGVAAIRDGFGETEAIVGVRAGVRF